MSWARLNDNDVWHVLPVNDLEDHENGFHCWCDPRVEAEGKGYLVVHNAADKREVVEVFGTVKYATVQ